MLSEKWSMKFFKSYPILPTEKLIVRLTDYHFKLGEYKIIYIKKKHMKIVLDGSWHYISLKKSP